MFLFGYFCIVPFRHGERIGFSYLISQKYTGDSALVKNLHNKEILEFNVKLAIHKKLANLLTSSLLALYLLPSLFLIFALRFLTLSIYLVSFYLTRTVTISHSMFLQYGKEYEYDAPVKLLEKHLHAMTQSVDEQLVVVSQVGFFCAIKRYSLPLISQSQ